MKTKLSPYTIASNCAVLTDIRDGINEIQDEYDFGRISVFRNTNRMALMFICPKINLKEKNLLRKKSRRIRDFQASGLKSSIPSVQ